MTLNEYEIEQISGSFAPPTNIHPRTNARIALTSFRGLGAVGAAFTAGYNAGGFLAEHTQIDEWLADTAWGLFH